MIHNQNRELNFKNEILTITVTTVTTKKIFFLNVHSIQKLITRLFVQQKIDAIQMMWFASKSSNMWIATEVHTISVYHQM